jgi:caffeoyl-CoA O-methyltransferase
MKHHSQGRGLYSDPKMLDFVTKLVSREPAALRRIRETTEAKGLPPISIGPDEGRLLHFLVAACGARKAVEVGTLAGYSACWIAGALPADGVLHTFEHDAKHAAVARANIKAAGLSSKVSIHEGAALKTLTSVEGDGPYDFVFIDADKVNYANYLRWAVDNTRPGAIVVGDNAYLFGKLHLDAKRAGEDARGVPAMREFLKMMADERLFSSCAMVPTGEGMAVAVRA